jgi:hypothetical protein
MPVALLNPYCSVDQLRAELKNSAIDPAFNDELANAINAASRWVDNYCGRDFFYHDHRTSPVVITPWMETTYKETLWLPYRPVIALTKVEVEGVEWTLDEDYIIHNNDRGEGVALIAIGTEAYRSTSTAMWTVGKCADDFVRLTGEFGYSQRSGVTVSHATVPSGVPEEITQVTLLVAAAFSGHNKKQVIDMTGGVQSVLTKDIPKTVFTILDGKRALLV